MQGNWRNLLHNLQFMKTESLMLKSLCEILFNQEITFNNMYINQQDAQNSCD